MASAKQLQIENLGTKYLKKGQVAKDILSVAEADYLTVLRGIAATETAAQIRLGNKPTNIIVDGKKNKPIDQAEKSVVVYFVSARDMLAATIEAWREMQIWMMRDTGRTASQLQLWRSDGGKERYVGTSVSSIPLSSITNRTTLYVVGPVTANTRKFRWLSKAGKKFAASKRRELKGLRTSSRPKTTVSLQTQVIKRIKRKYNHLGIVEAWLNVADLNPGGKTPVTRIPAISIHARGKGRV